MDGCALTPLPPLPLHYNKTLNGSMVVEDSQDANFLPCTPHAARPAVQHEAASHISHLDVLC